MRGGRGPGAGAPARGAAGPPRSPCPGLPLGDRRGRWLREALHVGQRDLSPTWGHLPGSAQTQRSRRQRCLDQWFSARGGRGDVLIGSGDVSQGEAQRCIGSESTYLPGVSRGPLVTLCRELLPTCPRSHPPTRHLSGLLSVHRAHVPALSPLTFRSPIGPRVRASIRSATWPSLARPLSHPQPSHPSIHFLIFYPSEPSPIPCPASPHEEPTVCWAFLHQSNSDHVGWPCPIGP